MKPAEFKSRFIALLSDDIPDGLDLGLDAFVSYPRDRAESLDIDESDRAFLTDSGLPEDAAPFLSFKVDAERSLMPLEEFPDSAMIGYNGCGDAICIDQADGGAVVFYNHDNNMRRVLMNTSLRAFAASLCAFSSFMKNLDEDTFRQEIAAIDPSVSEPKSFWILEMESRLGFQERMREER